MRAAVRERYGNADVVHVAGVPRPRPQGTEVLVEVRAAGLDRGTVHLMTGLPLLGRLAFGLRRPRNLVLGMELAGTVVAVGPKATRFAVGDEVYGTGRGSFAELAVAAEGRLARKPANLSFAQAAIVPVSGCTALQALDLARARAGHRILVTGASGGVGSFAAQLARARGARVTGVAGPTKTDLVRSWGVEPLDRTAQDWADGTRRWDVVLDVAGNPPVSRLRSALAAGGAAVVVGGEEGGRLTGGLGRQLTAVAVSPFVRERLAVVLGVTRATDLDRLTALLEAGDVVPALDRTYPLAEAADAIRALEGGAVRGKLAVTP
jgi:NADPH:quinone reductase-like Zn-dependent oxidoreductase